VWNRLKRKGLSFARMQKSAQGYEKKGDSGQGMGEEVAPPFPLCF
jgi:hypothetical protein